MLRNTGIEGSGYAMDKNWFHLELRFAL
jgi:hypothetical protein